MITTLKNFLCGFTFKHSPHPHGESIVKVNNLRVIYDKSIALDDLTFQLTPGERVAIVGPNGAGKTTLFKTLVGLLKPVQGDVQIFGNDPHGHICISYLPQRSEVDWEFPVDVSDVVMMGRAGKLGLFRNPGPKDRRIVAEALELVNMVDYSKSKINELSGGQQQRVFIARALAQEAELLLLDEPFTGLDSNAQEDIFKILAKLQERSVTILVSMHDLNLATEKFDRVMLLNRKLYGFGKPGEVLSRENLQEAYGSHLHLLEKDDTTFVISDTHSAGDR